MLLQREHLTQIKEDMHDPSSIKAKAISSPQASIGFVVTKNSASRINIMLTIYMCLRHSEKKVFL